MDSNILVANLPGIGNHYSKKLARLEINTLEDLIYHFPFRYEDFSNQNQILNLTADQNVTLQGSIQSIKNIRTRTGKYLTLATLRDQSGFIEIVWFNQPYLTKSIKEGTILSVSGKAKLEYGSHKLISPAFEILVEKAQLKKPSTIHTGRLVPIYGETAGISSKWIRAKISQLLKFYLKSQKDFLPTSIIKRQKLASLSKALSNIHYPNNFKDVETAKKRLGFDELFTLQLAAAIRRKTWKREKIAQMMKIDTTLNKDFLKSLPFKLTSAQQTAAGQILKDLTRKTPANRLLEGDVGSGKTVVGAIAAYCAIYNGFQTLFAAPTEILATQHYQTLCQLFAPFGVKIGIWTANKKEDGDIVCGTHALLISYKSKKNLGFVIVDEQHRFGVAQRGKLSQVANNNKYPHILTMTATPIPRTLALTIYQDLDLSVLDEMPKGRKKIQTFVVPNKKRSDAYSFIEKRIKEGRQAFIITPFVEPSESMVTVKAATNEFEKLKDIFSTLVNNNPRENSTKIKLGLLHGRLKSKEKDEIMHKFKKGKIDILVATPIVEVGIDIPNATIMMIESADRFGLAQLHQLRGRVGRGIHRSYCFIFTDSNSINSTKRLKSMEKVDIGFELAEIDLKMRGPGEIFGLRQSGYVNLKIADLSDEKLITTTQKEANAIVELDPHLKKYPLLAKKIEKEEAEYVQPN